MRGGPGGPSTPSWELCSDKLDALDAVETRRLSMLTGGGSALLRPDLGGKLGGNSVTGDCSEAKPGSRGGGELRAGPR